MKKLWKVTVNNWGWDAPRTYFAESKLDALKIYRRFPAADPIRYAGSYCDDKAAELVKASVEYLEEPDWGEGSYMMSKSRNESIVDLYLAWTQGGYPELYVNRDECRKWLDEIKGDCDPDGFFQLDMMSDEQIAALAEELCQMAAACEA